MNISAYLDAAKLENLCKEIRIPDEVSASVLRTLPGIDPDSVSPYFSGLFTLETGHESTQKIKVAFPENPNGLQSLPVFLASALRSRELYGERGIDDQIFLDTFGFFQRFIREHRESFGAYGFDREWWIYRDISLNLFRLGTLEFELTSADEDIPGYAGKGDSILSVHIPSDAVMTPENLAASYTMAREFFPKHFPDRKIACTTCNSWLLSPKLTELLPETSKIRLFQSDYTLSRIDEEPMDFMVWVYKREYTDYTLLPEETSLQRSIKKVLCRGEKIGSALGVLNKP